MTYEKLNDTLDKKMLDFNLKILALLASLFIKPISLATEPFFRKNFGERYFTGTGFFISIILWNLAQSLSNSIAHSPLVEILRDANCTTLATWAQEYHFSGRVAWLISFIYGFIGMRQYIIVRSRRRKGKEWHSMSRGDSIFGRESRVRDFLILFLGSGLLGIVAPAVGFLFAVSQYASIFLAIKMEKSFYNRYLDIVDAKLENEFMQQCLDRGEPPTDLNGLFYPLPKAIQGENRIRVARVVAGTQFAANVPVAEQPTAQARQQSPPTQRPGQQTADTPQPDLDSIAAMRSQVAAMKPVFEGATKFAGRAVSSIVGFLASKQFMRATVAVLILLVIVIGAIYGVELIKAHWQATPKPPVVQTVLTPPTAHPETVKPPTPPVSVAEPVSFAPQIAATPPAIASQPTIAPAVETKSAPEQTTKAIAITPEIDKPAEKSIVIVQQDGSNAAPAKPVMAISQQINEPQPQKPVVVSQDDNIAPAPAKTGLAAAIDALNTFSNYCFTALAADNERIERIQNNGTRAKMSAASLQIQTGIIRMISHQQEYLGSLTPGPEAEASLARSIANLNIPRDSATNALTRFEAETYNATLRR